MRWRGFTDELIGGLTELGVEMVILIGALLADSPHTRPVPVQVSGSEPALLRNVGSEPADYKGAAGIVGVLAYMCARPTSPRSRCGRRCRTTSRSRPRPR